MIHNIFITDGAINGAGLVLPVLTMSGLMYRYYYNNELDSKMFVCVGRPVYDP